MHVCLEELRGVVCPQRKISVMKKYAWMPQFRNRFKANFLTSVASLSEVEFHILMKVIRQFLLFAPCCILSLTKADFVGSNLGDPERSFVGLLRMNLNRPSLGLWNTVLLSGILFCSPSARFPQLFCSVSYRHSPAQIRGSHRSSSLPLLDTNISHDGKFSSF